MAVVLLYRELLHVQDTKEQLALVVEALRSEKAIMLYFVLALVLLNWGLESLKWQSLTRSLHDGGFWQAFSAVLVGTSLGLFTPNRTGEFLGRVLFLPDGKRVSGAFANSLGSLSQLVVTIVIGTICLGLFLTLGYPSPLQGQFVNRFLIVLSFSIGLIALLVYFHPGILKRAVEILPFIDRWRKEADVLVSFRKKELARILGLSTMRYMVFTIQFVLALHAVGIELDLLVLFLSVPIIYLINTIVPSVVLTELAIRSAVAVHLLKPMGAEYHAVVLASFAIWLFNLVLPAAFGAVLFLVNGRALSLQR